MLFNSLCFQWKHLLRQETTLGEKCSPALVGSPSELFITFTLYSLTPPLHVQSHGWAEDQSA